MIAFARLMIFGFIFLTIVYICIVFYSRSVRKAKLGDEWDADIKEGDREAFIQEGLAEYESSLRRKLILGVYVVPICVVMLILYLTNFA